MSEIISIYNLEDNDIEELDVKKALNIDLLSYDTETLRSVLDIAFNRCFADKYCTVLNIDRLTELRNILRLSLSVIDNPFISYASTTMDLKYVIKHKYNNLILRKTVKMLVAGATFGAYMYTFKPEYSHVYLNLNNTIGAILAVGFGYCTFNFSKTLWLRFALGKDKAVYCQHKKILESYMNQIASIHNLYYDDSNEFTFPGF